jgi:uncharacterized membrane protein YdbT with pleckstrin-like domain
LRPAGQGLEGKQLVLRTRLLARLTVVAPRGKLQSRGYSVSPFQRRKRLATLRVEVASGSSGKAFRLADADAVAVANLVQDPRPGTVAAKV